MDCHVLASCYCCYHPGIPVAMVTVTLWILHWRWLLSFWDVACTLILVRALVQLCNGLIERICHIRFEKTVFASCCECRPVTGYQWCVCTTAANPRWALWWCTAKNPLAAFKRSQFRWPIATFDWKLTPLCCGEWTNSLQNSLGDRGMALQVKSSNVALFIYRAPSEPSWQVVSFIRYYLQCLKAFSKLSSFL